MSIPIDLPGEQKKVRTRSVAAAVVSALALAGFYIVLPRLWTFPDDTAERIAFALRADIFVFLWVAIGVQRVSSGRYRSAADNRGSAFAAPSPAIATKVAFLQNTLEQAFLAIGAHLAVAATAGGAPLALIPGAVTLFAIGRITFAIGYPHGAGARAFGVALTLLPSLILYGVALWHIVWPG